MADLNTDSYQKTPGGILTNLLADIYHSMDMANDELVGFLPAVKRNSELASLAKGETIRLWDVEVPAAKEYRQSMTIADNDAEDIDYKDDTMTITDQWKITFAYKGENVRALQHQGKHNEVMSKAFFNAFRQMNAQIERHIAKTAIEGACRAYGKVGTAPFSVANKMTEVAELGLIFDQNGTPTTGRKLVLNNYAIRNIRANMSNLFKVNEAGSPELLRTGLLNLPLEGFSIWQSNALETRTVGTGSGYKVPTGDTVKDVAKGALKLTLDTGSGTLLAGDIIYFGASTDTNADALPKYVVKSGLTAASEAIELARPGLIDVVNKGTAVTKLAAYTPSVAFQEDSIILGMRVPYIPPEGDGAIDRTLVMSRYGIPYMISVYPGHGMNQVELSTTWGCKVLRPQNVALLIQ